MDFLLPASKENSNSNMLIKKKYFNFIKNTSNLFFQKTPIYDYILMKDISSKISIILNDPWQGDRRKGQDIIDGYIKFYGETVYYKTNIWEKNNASKLWKEELHSFSWARDIRSIGTNNSRLFLRKSVEQWIKKYNKWSEFEWKDSILAKRVSSLIENFMFYCSSAEESFQDTLLKSICKQANHLFKKNISETDGFDRILIIKSIIIVALTFNNFKKKLNFGINLLLLEIENQILQDGCHYLKSPSIHLEFLKNLIDIKSYLIDAKKNIPQKLDTSISKSASVLKFFKSGNGLLSTFNRSSYKSNNELNQVLIRANSKLKTPLFLEKSGFRRLSKNKITFIMDCGNPVKEDVYAGSLSFEFSFAKSQIVVNSGPPHINNKKWMEAMKSTAAHSTASIDNTNSSDIFFQKLKKRTDRIANVWSKNYQKGSSYWIDAAHSGYQNFFGLIHSRKIHIDTKNKIIRGHDYLFKTKNKYLRIPKNLQIRFHLHPKIDINITGSKKKAILKLPDGNGWEFICSESNIEINESIYLSGGQNPIRSNHIFISSPIIPNKKIKWLFRLIN